MLTKNRKLGFTYAILASILWAIVTPFIKQGLSYDMTPMNFAGIRFTLVGVFILLYTLPKHSIKQVFQHKRLFAVLILMNMFLGYTTFYFGVDLVSAAVSSIILGLTPLINVLLAHFVAHNDRLDRRKVISMAISLVGLLLIIGVGSKEDALGWKGYLGVLLLFLNIIFQGYAAILISEDKGNVNPVFMNGVQMFFGGLLLYGVGVATEGYHSFIGLPAGFYGSLGVLVFVSLFAFNFWFMALQKPGMKVSEINMCRLINPILGAFLSWYMLPDESPTLNTVLGMIIIVSSLFYFFKGGKK